MNKKPYRKQNQRRSSTPQLSFSQNFIAKNKIAREVVELSEITKKDTVIEIGSGKGMLTKFIVEKAGKTIAIEKDYNLYEDLKALFEEKENTTLICQDFLHFREPSREEYHVIGNIPFGLSAQIIKKLLLAKNSPVKSTIIVQKEFADRVIGKQHQGRYFALLFYPFFYSSIIKHLSKFDFEPIPQVSIVVLQVTKRENPLVSSENKALYYKFIDFCFSKPSKNAQDLLRHVFTRNQLQRIISSNKLLKDKTVSEVTNDEWVGIFKTFLEFGNEEMKQRFKYTRIIRK